MDHAYQRTTLKNGTRVLLVPSHDTLAVTVMAMYEVGSRYETLKQSGASHYVEHMMFKGTKRRPTTGDISRDLDGVGADYNAFTGKDYTGYYIRLDAAHTELAVDMLHDMLYHSSYKTEECARERGVILEEINMYEDNPIMHADEYLEALMFEGSPLGRMIAGTHKTMNGITRSALVKYRDEHYVPSKTVVVVSGKIGPDVLDLLEKTFGAVTKNKKEPRGFTKTKPKTGRPRLAIKFKDTEQVLFTVGFPGFPYGHKRLPALNVLATVLGGGMSSRLFMEVRERRGLAYSVSADVGPYQDCGTFAVFAGLTKAKVEEGIRVIMHELTKAAEHGVTAEELSRAKEYVKGKTILRLESSTSLGDFYAKQELLTRRIETPEEKIAKIMAVTREDVRAAAREILQTSKLSATIIGPYKDKTPFMKLLKI